MSGGETDMHKIRSIDVSKLLESTRNLELATVNVNNRINDAYNQIIESNQAKDKRDKESHAALLQIAENTEGIKELVSLVREGNQINEKTFELIQKLHSIMKCVLFADEKTENI